MSDFKSMLPDLKELSSMTNKLYKGIKTSVEEIIKDYKDKRASAEETKPVRTTSAEAPVVTQPMEDVSVKTKKATKVVSDKTDEIK